MGEVAVSTLVKPLTCIGTSRQYQAANQNENYSTYPHQRHLRRNLLILRFYARSFNAPVGGECGRRG
jgi:hypothetical protein